MIYNFFVVVKNVQEARALRENEKKSVRGKSKK
jgi:hypothetical protein